MGTGGFQEGLAEQVAVKQRPDGDEGAGHWGKSFPDIMKSKCQSPEVRTSSIMCGDSKEARAAGAGWASSKVVRRNQRGKVGRPDSEGHGEDLGVTQREVGSHGRVWGRRIT